VEETRESRGKWTYDSIKARCDVDEMSKRAKETTSEGADRAKEYAHDAKERTKDVAGCRRKQGKRETK